MYILYQVQLERNVEKIEDCRIYSLEVPTNDFDAVELAKIYIADKYNDYYDHFSLGGYCEIGHSETQTIIDNTKQELKPCPFCGNTAVLKENEFQKEQGKEDKWAISCVSFDCGTKQMWLATREEAIRRWNTRNSK